MPRSSVWLEGMAGNMFSKKCRLDAQPLIDPLLRGYTVVSVFESKWKQAIVLERIEWIRGISLLPRCGWQSTEVFHNSAGLR